MHCLLGCLAFLAPRLMLAALYFQGYLERAYESVLWPVLGFVFMPLTTIAYAWGINEGGSIRGVYFVVVILAVLADLGVIGSARPRGED